MHDQSPTIVCYPFDNAGASDRTLPHVAAMVDDDFVPAWEKAGVEDDAGQTGDWTGSPLFGDAPGSSPGLDSMDFDADEGLFFNTSVAFFDNDRTLYSPDTPSLSYSPASTVTPAAPTPFRVDDASAFPELSHLPPDWQGNSLTAPSLGLEVSDYDGLPLLADVPLSSRELSPFPIQLPHPSSTRRHPQASESWAPAVLEPSVSVNAIHHYATWGWECVPPT